MMKTPDRKVGKVFLVFAGLCIIGVPFLVMSALSGGSEKVTAAPAAAESRSFDQNGNTIFENYDRITEDYLKGTSPARTLAEFYSRREYSGSPPIVPHKVEEKDGSEIDCLACHAKGGWTAELKRHTPVVPHPERIYCRQCHVGSLTEALFVEHDWQSSMPPRLGRAHLPGGPPPIPHGLQTRGNCIACHVGPGAVDAIRVDHQSRGNCRQCHVPDLFARPFTR